MANITLPQAKSNVRQLATKAKVAGLDAPKLLERISDKTVSKVNIASAKALVDNLYKQFQGASGMEALKLSTKLDLARELQKAVETQYDKQGYIESWNENAKDRTEDMKAEAANIKGKIGKAVDTYKWGINEGLVKPLSQGAKEAVDTVKWTADMLKKKE